MIKAFFYINPAPMNGAIIASTNPPGTLLVLKLHIAATSARIDTRLNAAPDFFSLAMNGS